MTLELITPAAIMPVSVVEAKAFLRVEHMADDAMIAGLVRAATQLCEDFVGRVLLTSAWRQTTPVTTSETLLRKSPVRAVTAVALADSAGGVTPVDNSARTIDIDADGRARVRLLTLSSTAISIVIDFTAGEFSDANGVPEPLRQGLLRLIAHLYDHRDSIPGGAPPAAIAALWRPYRWMSLS